MPLISPGNVREGSCGGGQEADRGSRGLRHDRMDVRRVRDGERGLEPGLHRMQATQISTEEPQACTEATQNLQALGLTRLSAAGRYGEPFPLPARTTADGGHRPGISPSGHRADRLG